MDIQHELYKLAIYVSMMVNLPWAIYIYPPRIVAAKSIDGGFWEIIGILCCIFMYFPASHVTGEDQFLPNPFAESGKEPDVASPPKPITSRALRADSAGGARSGDAPGVAGAALEKR